MKQDIDLVEDGKRIAFFDSETGLIYCEECGGSYENIREFKKHLRQSK